MSKMSLQSFKIKEEKYMPNKKYLNRFIIQDEVLIFNKAYALKLGNKYI